MANCASSAPDPHADAASTHAPRTAEPPTNSGTTHGATLAARRDLPPQSRPTNSAASSTEPTGATAELVVALVAIHALGKKETSHLLLGDLDLPSGQLHITRSGTRHTVYLDEAAHTADPIHLMRVFGISDQIAMKYVQAAHPEQSSG